MHICATLDMCAIYITESFIRVPYIEWVIITWIWIIHMSLYMCAIYIASHSYVCDILYICVAFDMCAIYITSHSYVCHLLYMCMTHDMCAIYIASHIYNWFMHTSTICTTYRMRHDYLNISPLYVIWYVCDTWYVCHIYHQSFMRVSYIYMCVCVWWVVHQSTSYPESCHTWIISQVV